MQTNIKYNTSKNTLFLASSFVIVFCLFYFLEQFSPFINDDPMYAFICGKLPLTPVQSLSDAIESQSYAYHTTNGRFMVHVIVQLFCGLKLITLYHVASSFMFAMLWLGLMKLIQQKYGFNKSDSIVVLFALLIGVPAIGISFLGNIACGINYLWTSTIIIWLLVLFQHINTNTKLRPVWINILIFATGMFSCALQESFSIPFAGGMFIYFCLNRREFHGSMRYLFFGIALGTCLVVFSPSNFARAANMHDDSSFIMGIIMNTYRLLECCIVTEIFVICTIVALIKSKAKCIKFLKDNIILVSANIISILFMLFVAFTAGQQTTCMEIFSLILLYSLFRTYASPWYTRKSKIVACICLLAFIPIYSYAYICRQKVAIAYDKLYINAMNSKDGYAVAHDYLSYWRESNSLFRRFTRMENLMATGISAEYDKKWMSAVITNGKDTTLVRQVLPLSKQEIIQSCNKENEISSHVYWLPQIKMYVVSFPEGNAPQRVRIWVRRPWIHYVLDRMRNKDGSKEIEVDYKKTYDNFVANGYCYYIISYGDYYLPVTQVKVEQ